MSSPAAEFVVARRLRTGYVGALEGGLRRQVEELDPVPQYSMADFTIAGGLGGLDRASIQRALGTAESKPAASRRPTPPPRPIRSWPRSSSSGRATPRAFDAALRKLPHDPLLIGALVPLLAIDELVRPVVTALTGFGARAAGEMAWVLLDPGAPDVVRRRLPLALKSCPSPVARDALLASLESPVFELRLRCGRALIALTDEHPELLVPFPGVLNLVFQEVGRDVEPHLAARARLQPARAGARA